MEESNRSRRVEELLKGQLRAVVQRWPHSPVQRCRCWWRWGCAHQDASVTTGRRAGRMMSGRTAHAVSTQFGTEPEKELILVKASASHAA